jgi:hypothetical protein
MYLSTTSSEEEKKSTKAFFFGERTGDWSGLLLNYNHSSIRHSFPF